MPSASRSNAKTWAFGLGAMAFLMLCGIVSSLLDVWRANQALTWPTAGGRVIESRADTGCGRRGTAYHVVVRYRYEAGGRAHESRRILYGAGTCSSESEAKAHADRYPVGASVKVSFDPQAPAEAVLMPGEVHQDAKAAIAFLSLWFVLALMAMGMLVIVARSEPSGQKALDMDMKR